MSSVWAPDIQKAVLEDLRKFVHRRRLVFVQLNPALADALAATVAIELLGPILDGAGFDWVSDDHAQRMLALDVSVLADAGRGAGDLGRLREAVNDRLDADPANCVCLLSRAPRIAFPRVPGSSLLDDCSFFSVKPSIFEVADEARSDISFWGSPVDRALLASYLECLGLDVLASIDRILFDMRVHQAIPTELLTARELEAVQGAGLIQVDPRHEFCSFAVAPADLMPVLADVIAESIDVQDAFGEVVAGLARIERRLRREVRRAAIAQFGEKWRGEAVQGGLVTSVVEKATREAPDRPDSVKALRDPLEWLTMPELIEAIRSRPWATMLGRPRTYWDRMEQEVAPIRNRTAHLRLLRKDDLEVVKRWDLSLSRLYP